MKILWPPKVLNTLAAIPHWYHKNIIKDVSVNWILKGLPLQHLTLWLLRDACCKDIVSLPQSVRQWPEQLQCLQERFTSNAGKNGSFGVLERVYQTVPFLPLN